MTAAVEIDTRRIPGNGGTVKLLTELPLFERYTVEVEDCAGVTVALLQELDRTEAREAFLHTFARQDVPDVFTRAL